MTSSETSTEPPRRGPALFVLGVAGVSALAGWGFVLWHHHFRVTAPVIVLMLGWLAVIASVYFLWRTADNADLDDAEDWWRPAGRREELVREKKSLFKAIKETEHDRDTGKLSKEDADDLMLRYRSRAIDVIKALEEAEAAAEAEGAAGDASDRVRARIEREVRARVAIDGVADRKRDKKARADKEAAKPAAEKESA
jgi:hypothetical protein